MGTKVDTPAGNTVVVHSFLASVGKAPTGKTYVAADIEACGGPHATTVTGVDRTLFQIETDDKTAWPSVPGVKKPVLKGALLTPNKCQRGWVTFSIPKTRQPLYVILYSSGLVKWTIPG